MNRIFLETSGVLSNNFKITDSNNNIIYECKQNVFKKFFILLVRPWINPVNLKLKGFNGNENLIIKYSGKNNNNIFNNDSKIGEILGRERIATKYRFSVNIDDKEYFFEGDSVEPMGDIFFNNSKIGVVKVKNQTFPHFDWEVDVYNEIDIRVIVVILIYNYCIWARV